MNQSKQSLQIAQSITFYTDIKFIQQKQSIQESKLRNYVDKLTNKIQYAKWKQQQVLKYNYMPIKDLIQKIEGQTNVFKKKIQQQQQKYRKIVENKDMLEQMNNLHKFSKILDIKTEQFEKDLMKASIRRNQLRKQVQQRKNQLQRQRKQIMNLQAKKLSQKGIKNLVDIFSILKQKKEQKKRKALFERKVNSELTFHYQSVPKLNFNTQRKIIDKGQQQTQDITNTITMLAKTDRKRSISSLEENIYKKQKNLTVKRKESIWKPLFIQCLNLILQKDNQGMISHRLEVQKKLKNIDKVLPIMKISTNNNNKYNNNKTHRRAQSEIDQRQKEKNNQQKDIVQRVAKNFQCTWQNFKYLNWKQILRYIMGQKNGGKKLRNLL